MSYLTVDRVAKAFGKDEVLNDASLEVGRGEMVAIFGASGTGKTVLLRLIAGVERPSAGDVIVDGKSVLDMAPEARATGMAFQNFALYPHMSAFENIASPLRARRVAGAEIERRVTETAELLRIDHVLHHLPRELSNGQKQRTSLGRALVREPKILLLDDPLRNVDAKLRYEMRVELPRLLKRFDSTVLYVTQDYKEAMALGERVAVLHDGRFVQVDRPGAVYVRPSSVEVARLFGDPTINLYPCRPRAAAGGVEIDVLGHTVSLPGHGADSFDRPCLVGIRPEDVRVDLDRRPGAIPVELDAVTPLNVRTVLFLRTAGKEEVFATCSEAKGEAFGRGHRAVFASIDAKKALLFDAETGARLAT